MDALEESYQSQNCWGMVASVDCYHCDRTKITNPEEIKRFIYELCDHIKMVRHGEPLIERFAEGAMEGYSAMQFIETSSVTMHFDEEQDRSFIDIFSCKYFNPQEAEKFCREFLSASSSKVTHYFRV
ncbi:MAG: S-adenosylmethionine decarboxylase [Candidatus Vogelbacteria bacterium]|nr:S-adenosylmethionine decarboxylase [Candidatus Vogelbacteria bacterium]